MDIEHSTDPVASSSPNTDKCMDADDVTEKEEEELGVSKTPESNPESEEALGSDKATEWVEWRECSDSIELSPTSTDTPGTCQFSSLPNGEVVASEAEPPPPSSSSSAPQSAEVDEIEGSGRGKEGEEETSEEKK